MVGFRKTGKIQGGGSFPIPKGAEYYSENRQHSFPKRGQGPSPRNQLRPPRHKFLVRLVPPKSAYFVFWNLSEQNKYFGGTKTEFEGTEQWIWQDQKGVYISTIFVTWLI